jgi:hypothetical protein
MEERCNILVKSKKRRVVDIFGYKQNMKGRYKMTEQKEKAAQTAVTVKRQGVSNDTYVTTNRIPEKLPICKNKFQTVDAETVQSSMIGDTFWKK